MQLAYSSLAYVIKWKKLYPLLSQYGGLRVITLCPRRQHIECIVGVTSTTASCSILYCILHKKENNSGFALQLIVPDYLKKSIFQNIYNFVIGGHLGEKSLLYLGKQYYYFA